MNKILLVLVLLSFGGCSNIPTPYYKEMFESREKADKRFLLLNSFYFCKEVSELHKQEKKDKEFIRELRGD